MGHHKYRKTHKGILSLLITAFILQIIWNALIPDLFGGPALSYFHSILIILISRLLSGSKQEWKKETSGNYDWDKKEWKDSSWTDCGKGDWRKHFEEKWNKMESEINEIVVETEEEIDEEFIAKQEAAREEMEFKDGFTEGGKFDVNVTNVDEDTQEDEGDEKVG